MGYLLNLLLRHTPLLFFYFSEEINESQLNTEKCSIESSVMHQTCKHSNDSYLTCLAKHKMCFENFTFDI